eukprot:scaffold37611_cov69-Phaeocystis_antarctica.AAC.6
MLDCEPAYTQSCQNTCRRCVHGGGAGAAGCREAGGTRVWSSLHAEELGREMVKRFGSRTAQ